MTQSQHIFKLSPRLRGWRPRLTGLYLACMASTVSAQTLVDVVQRALTLYPAILSAQAKADSARADIARARSAHDPPPPA